jgi:hypothetical protein
MQHLRVGSVVTLKWIEISTSTTVTDATVSNMTNSYIEVEYPAPDTTVRVVPWDHVGSLVVTQD